MQGKDFFLFSLCFSLVFFFLGDSIRCWDEENSMGISGISIPDLGKLKRSKLWISLQWWIYSAVFFKRMGLFAGGFFFFWGVECSFFEGWCRISGWFPFQVSTSTIWLIC